MTISRRQLEFFHLRAQTYVAAAGALSATMLSIASIYVGMQIARQTDARSRETDQRAAGYERLDVKLRCVSGFLQARQATRDSTKPARRVAMHALTSLIPPECRALPEMRQVVRNVAILDMDGGARPSAPAIPRNAAESAATN